jgi:hypothetical protein
MMIMIFIRRQEVPISCSCLPKGIKHLISPLPLSFLASSSDAAIIVSNGVRIQPYIGIPRHRLEIPLVVLTYISLRQSIHKRI